MNGSKLVMAALAVSAATLIIATPFRIANAADMPVKAPYTKAPPPAVVYSWTGWYLGGDIGGAWADADLTHSPFFATTAPVGGFQVDANALAAAASPSLRANGVTGGIHGGYNFQSGNIVYGGEADFAGMSLNSSQSGVFPFPSTLPGGALGPPTLTFNAASSYHTDWQGTLRGRIGLASNDWLFYATGGLAVADFRINQNAGSLIAGSSFSTASFTDTRAGWVVGGGIEHAFANNWMVRVEYLHADYGTANNGTFINFPTGIANAVCVAGAPSVAGPAVIGAGCSLATHLTTDLVRVGVSYKFGGPVVANY
jgi:outer membrane immunogenic protein